MSQKFDWQAEDEESWGSFDPQSLDRSRSSSPRRKWLVAAFFLLLLSMVAFFSFRRVQNYISEAATVVEDDILSSHELALQAATTADSELMTSVLSGRDSEWTSSQLNLLEQNLLLDRRALGLSWQSDLPSNNVTVTISPDLSESFVTQELIYNVHERRGEIEQITLEQTTIYRRGEDRWLLSPPAAAYWGDTILVQGRFFELTFPEKDEELGRRLAADFEGVLAEACNVIPGIDCEQDIQLDIRLVAEPDIFFEINRPESRLNGGKTVLLPTPTIVGNPIDENGYRALHQAYAERIVSAFIAQAANWQCCDHVLFYQALLDMQLAEMGLRSWPISQEQYQQALQKIQEVDEILWSSDVPLDELLARPDWWLAYLLAEYIVAEWSSVPIIEMQRHLSATPQFPDWLVYVSGDTIDVSFINGWQLFLERKAQVSAGHPAS